MSKRLKASSKQWIERHISDPYVQQAQREGFRSRAVYKLSEVQDKYKFIKPGMRVVDLGAAPGGWSQVAINLVGQKGKVVAIDILPIEPITSVDIIQADFTTDEAYEALVAAIGDKKLDVVLSDLAPNLSGIKAVDQPKSMRLIEYVWDFAKEHLASGGTLFTKVFQGEGFTELLQEMRRHFDKVQVRKPSASRSTSTEVYLLGRGFKREKP